MAGWYEGEFFRPGLDRSDPFGKSITLDGLSLHRYRALYVTTQMALRDMRRRLAKELVQRRTDRLTSGVGEAIF